MLLLVCWLVYYDLVVAFGLMFYCLVCLVARVVLFVLRCVCVVFGCG